MTLFQELNAVETDNVEPVVTPVLLKGNLREDRVVTCDVSERVLQQAPERSGNLFQVPPVV